MTTAFRPLHVRPTHSHTVFANQAVDSSIDAAASEILT